MRELVARVEAVLRRSGMTPAGGRGERIEAPGLVIDPDLHTAMLDGEDAGLTRDRVPAAATCWPPSRGARSAATSCSSASGGCRTGTATAPSTSASASCARSLTGARPSHTYIQTHYGVGYRFDADGQGRVARALRRLRGRLAPPVRSGGGDDDAHRRALPDRALDGGTAAVRLRDVLDDRQPEAGARAGAGVLDPVEALEDPRQVLRRGCRRRCRPPSPRPRRPGRGPRPSPATPSPAWRMAFSVRLSSTTSSSRGAMPATSPLGGDPVSSIPCSSARGSVAARRGAEPRR